ncbi:MAG: peptidoglycan-binding protein [Bacilli bacterium]|nr:peptidoglycan-binding protein [Bacilli bacterium]
MYKVPVVPESIVVHLGSPDSNARNIRVSFVEYIKNVASGELYPNWPKEALKANIYAIISFALNRIYNEWYRSRGYTFDITSSSQYDQSFVEDRQFFETIYDIVDEIFPSYIVRSGQIQPLFASYCDGRNTTCSGLSQWGSVSLANQGLDALRILKYYYGDSVQLVDNATISPLMESYPGVVLSIGDAGDMIRLLKVQLNRIGQNYPAIPAIIRDTIYFDIEMENAVKVFQKTFSLPVTGEVDRSTWYKIKYYFNAVKKITNIYSEGISKKEVELKYPTVLKEGNQGLYIRDLHYYLSLIACFDDRIPNVEISGDTFNRLTKENVLAFQRYYQLPETGEVDVATWNKIIRVYQDYRSKVPTGCRYALNEFFSGRYLSNGMTGEDVLNLQRFLYLICEDSHEIPGVIVSGEYDSLTEKSVRFLQEKNGLEASGVLTATTWFEIVEAVKNLS